MCYVEGSKVNEPEEESGMKHIWHIIQMLLLIVAFFNLLKHSKAIRPNIG